MADEKHQQVMEKKKQWEETCQRRQQEVLQRAEDRQEELHRQLAEVEQSSTRALAKRDEQQAIKQLKQDLRNEEVEQAQAKLARYISALQLQCSFQLLHFSCALPNLALSLIMLFRRALLLSTTL